MKCGEGRQSPNPSPVTLSSRKGTSTSLTNLVSVEFSNNWLAEFHQTSSHLSYLHTGRYLPIVLLIQHQLHIVMNLEI